MPQGFKPLKRPTIPGTKQKRRAPSQPKPKVGKRIAPKKKAAVQDAVQKRVRMYAFGNPVSYTHLRAHET